MKSYDDNQRRRAEALLRSAAAFRDSGRPIPGHLLEMLAVLPAKALRGCGVAIPPEVTRARALVDRLRAPEPARPDAKQLPSRDDPRGAN